MSEVTTTIRRHPLRGYDVGGEQVPWSEWGRYLDERPQFTLDPAFHAGAYYVQEASSQFVGYLLRGRKIGRLLDLCAAPGGKTTIYSTLADFVVANEPVRARAGVLVDNVRKWGLGNVAVTMNSPAQIADAGELFDVVAVDAPCSGEGMWRKDDVAREQWSEDLVAMCAVRQREILREACRCVRPGGILMYSTCTFNRTENEEVLQHFADEVEACDKIEINSGWGIECGDVGPWQTFRFHHDKLKGEGFFVGIAPPKLSPLHPSAKHPRGAAVKNIFSAPAREEIKELSRWVAEPEKMTFAKIGETCYGYPDGTFDDVRRLSERLNVIYSGVEMGQVFKGTLKPDHALAMYVGLNRGATAEVELDREEALNYLRKSTLDAEKFTEGMNLVTYDGRPLGWAKRIGNRVNNLYPNPLRIMHL